MEEKKDAQEKKGINLATLIFLSVIILFTIAIVFGVVLRENNINSESIYKEKVSNTENRNQIRNNVIDNTISNEINDNHLEEITDENFDTNIDAEEIKEYSLEEIIDIIYAHNFYGDAIEEFDTIENASQEYLFAVATNSLMRRVDGEDFYLKDFNDELVRVFGPKANNLLKKESISEDEFFYNEEQDSFSIIGRGLAENCINTFIITDVKEIGKNIAVTTYEYIWESVNENGFPTYIDNASEVLIRGTDGEILLKFSVKEEKGFDGEFEYISYETYDAENNLVKDEKEYLKEHLNMLKDKRVINLEYDAENNKYIVISNKIIK